MTSRPERTGSLPMHAHANDLRLNIGGNGQAVLPQAPDVRLDRFAGIADRFLSRLTLRVAAGQRWTMRHVTTIVGVGLKHDPVFHSAPFSICCDQTGRCGPLTDGSLAHVQEYSASSGVQEAARTLKSRKGIVRARVPDGSANGAVDSATPGISTSCSWRSMVGSSTCGAPWMRTATCSTSSCSRD